MLSQASWPGAGAGGRATGGQTGAALVVGGGTVAGRLGGAVVDVLDVVDVVAGIDEGAGRSRTGSHPAGTFTVVVVGADEDTPTRAAASA
jgi:hypothetical protein